MEKGKQRRGRAAILILAVLLALFTALEVFLVVWLFGADYSAFERLVREEAPIPGLESGLSPQGLCPLPEGEYRFAMSGYLKGEPSRIYFFGGEKEPKYVTLRDGEGELKTHFGGVTCTGNYLVVANGNKLSRISLAEALAAENGSAVPVRDSLAIEEFRSVAYCYFYEGILYAGEFYRPGNYETNPSHHLTENGETNEALAYAYPVDEEKTGGVASDVPDFALSVRRQVQGIAICPEGIVLSTSYGLPDSELFFYEGISAKEPSGTFDGIPLYRLDASNLKGTLKTPCMSEEIFAEDGRLYLLYESMSNQYKYFVRRQIDDVLSLALSSVL